MTSRQSSEAINKLLRERKKLAKPRSEYGGDEDHTHPEERAPTITVASKWARSRVRRHADFVCDGSDDQEEIGAAIAALPSGFGGRVILTEGTFNISGTITISSNNVMIIGMGRTVTQIVVDPFVDPLFSLSFASRVHIRDLYIREFAT